MSLLLFFTSGSSGGGPVVVSAGGGTILIPDCSTGPGLTDVLLSNPGGSNPRQFPTWDLAMNRGVNEHGSLGFDLLISDMAGYVGQPERLRGKWVRWTHPTLGLWTGRIVDVRPDPDAGIVDCVAYGHTWQFRKRITPKIDRALSGPAGAIVQQVLTAVGREEPLPISGIDADEIGDPVTYEFRAQKVDDVIRAVQSRSDQDWYLDPETNRLQWRGRYGIDRTGDVQLVDSVHLAGYDPAFTLEGVSNVLFAQPSDNRYRATKGYWTSRPDDVDSYGRMEESQTYAGAVTRSSLAPIARADLERMARRGRALTLDVLDIDRIFSRFGVGDTIRVLLSRLNVAYDFRVLVQSWKADTGMLTCTGYIA